MKRHTLKMQLSALAMGILPALAIGAVENYNPVTDARLTNPEPENWLMTRGNYQGWSYSPLEQINASGTTIVMVTHDADLARRAQRNIHIVDGQVAELALAGAGA